METVNKQSDRAEKQEYNIWFRYYARYKWKLLEVKFMFLGSENYHIDVCSTSKEMNIIRRNTFHSNSQDIGLSFL